MFKGFLRKLFSKGLINTAGIIFVDRSLLNSDTTKILEYSCNKLIVAKIYDIEKYKYIWSLMERHNSTIRNNKFPENLLLDMETNKNNKIIVILDPEKDAGEEYMSEILYKNSIAERNKIYMNYSYTGSLTMYYYKEFLKDRVVVTDPEEFEKTISEMSI